jgi:hypothetical protein
MALTCSVSNKYFVALYFSCLVLATHVPAWSATQPAKDTFTTYYEALAHAEEALEAAKEKNLEAVAKHAQLALEAARTAQMGLQIREVNKEAQKDYAEGVKSLQDVVDSAPKINFEEAMQQIRTVIIKWRPYPVAPGNEPCHGDGCQLNANGCCANPGMTNCNRYYPKRKCTNWGSPCNSCYCM